MQLGNPAKLDAERNAMRDAFDSIWIPSPVAGKLERRAMQCAARLDAPNYEHARGNWVIVPGARFTGATNAVLYA